MTGSIENIQVRTYFPTPVLMVRLAGHGPLNQELARTILAREAAVASGEHSNLGGWQSSWDFADWGGPAGRTLLDAAMAVANRLTADRSGRPKAMNWRFNAWANVNRLGHANEFHTHPGSYWSGAYYVDDGGVGAGPGLGGELEIQDPRGVAPAMYAPALSFAVAGAQSVGASELIRPEPGLMIMFPAWLSHGVRPYRGERMRISVAFNLSL